MSDARKQPVTIALGFLFFLTLIPNMASADWVVQDHLTLIEYGDPAIARTGVLDIWYNNTLTNPPYGYPYWGTMHINGICNPLSVDLHGGDADGWVYEVINDYDTIQQYDPYSEWVAVMPYAYSGLPSDGSWGQDYPASGCPGGSEARHGFLALFVLFQEYQYSDNNGLHIADLYDCSDELGCNWYYVYLNP